MANVTYLLGAGASFDALPVVDKFEREIMNVKNILQGEMSSFIDTDPQIRDAINIAVTTASADLQFLYQGCIDHSSVDTFAKMFFLIKDYLNYRRVKRAIILFFELHHYFFKKIDKRYDAFLASILNVDPPRLPDHINIISWNYDYELERAYQKYIPGSGTSRPEDAYGEMVVHHKGRKLSSANGFQMVKLNGTVGYEHGFGKFRLGLNIDDEDNDLGLESFTGNNARLKRMLSIHDRLKPGDATWQPMVSFAWDREKGDEIVEQAKQILLHTDVLVIVGYSFPYFNRETDTVILNSRMIYATQKTRVYVQDPNANDVIESIKGMLGKSARLHVADPCPIHNLKQFYMPYEMGSANFL